jgi:hypothetical protein
MLKVIVFGIFATPMFYVIIMWFKERKRQPHSSDQPAVEALAGTAA